MLQSRSEQLCAISVSSEMLTNNNNNHQHQIVRPSLRSLLPPSLGGTPPCSRRHTVFAGFERRRSVGWNVEVKVIEICH
jgi:hypothetical protein